MVWKYIFCSFIVIIVSRRSFSNCSSFQLKITTCFIRIWHSTRQHFRAFTLLSVHHTTPFYYLKIPWHSSSFLCGWYSNIYFIFPWICIIRRIYIIESCITDVFSLVANKLSAIPNKTKYLLFNSRNINPQVININLDSDVISPSNSAKNLDVLFQSDMSLDNHISSIIKSC